MSWRELAWSGKMRRKRPDEDSTGFVTSIGVSQVSPAGSVSKSNNPRAASGPQEGMAVSVEPIGTRDDGRVSAVGRMRLGR